MDDELRDSGERNGESGDLYRAGELRELHGYGDERGGRDEVGTGYGDGDSAGDDQCFSGDGECADGRDAELYRNGEQHDEHGCDVDG